MDGRDRLGEREDRGEGDGSRGVALLAVIWIMALVLTLVGAFSAESGLSVRLAHNLSEGAKARAAADGGVFLAVAGLLNATQAAPWPADGTPRTLSSDGVELTVRVWDEGGKVDLNVAPDALLSGLLAEFGVAGDANATLVDAIADWRSPGGLHRLRAPTPSDYRAAGLGDGPPHRPFASVEGLRLVLGMTPDLYRKLAPCVTVYSRDQRVNPLNASEEVLLALPGLTRPDVESFVAARAAAMVQPAKAVSLLGAAQRYLTWSAPKAVTVRSEARLPSGAAFVREAVVELGRSGETPYRVMLWRQYVADDAPPPAGSETAARPRQDRADAAVGAESQAS